MQIQLAVALTKENRSPENYSTVNQKKCSARAPWPPFLNHQPSLLHRKFYMIEGATETIWVKMLIRVSECMQPCILNPNEDFFLFTVFPFR